MFEKAAKKSYKLMWDAELCKIKGLITSSVGKTHELF